MNTQSKHLIGTFFLSAGLTLAGCGTDHSPVSTQTTPDTAPTYVSGETAYFALSPSFNGAAKVAADEDLSDEAYAQIPAQIEALLSGFAPLNQGVQGHFDGIVAPLQSAVVAAETGVVRSEAVIADAQTAYDAIATHLRHQEAVLEQMESDADAELARQDAVLEDLEAQIEAAKDADDEALEDQLKADEEAQEDYIKTLEEQFKTEQEAQEDLIDALADALKPKLEKAKKDIEAAEDGLKKAHEARKDAKERVVKKKEDIAEDVHLAHGRVAKGATELQGARNRLAGDLPDYASAASLCATAIQTLAGLVADGVLTSDQTAALTQSLRALEQPLHRRGVKHFEAAKKAKGLAVKAKEGGKERLWAEFAVVENGLEQDETITMTVLGDRLDNLVVAFKPAGLVFNKDGVLVVTIGSDLVNVDDLDALVAYHQDATGNQDAVAVEYVENGSKLRLTIKVPGFSRYGMW